MSPEMHSIVIDPPNPERIHYLVTCSFGDLTRTCRNNLEAKATAWGHFSDVALKQLDEQEELHTALLSGQEDYTSLFDSVMGLDDDTNI